MDGAVACCPDYADYCINKQLDTIEDGGGSQLLDIFKNKWVIIGIAVVGSVAVSGAGTWISRRRKKTLSQKVMPKPPPVRTISAIEAQRG
ncbi:hypothetical protein HK104_002268 [Borealophlyctis nickersoniae]|nr:hypothetical protein HK104_002268 [Borealophlyctis nickersoniae]